MSWQPIDTAPKDGTQFLIARAGEDVGCDPIEISKWVVIPLFRWEQVEGDPEVFRKVPTGTREFWEGNGHRATHWMPLPEPPK